MKSLNSLVLLCLLSFVFAMVLIDSGMGARQGVALFAISQSMWIIGYIWGEEA